MTFLVKEVLETHMGTPSSVKQWLTEEEIGQQPKFMLDSSTVLMLKTVAEKLRKNESVYPCEVLECVKAGNEDNLDGRREADRIGERPQLVRAKSLEDQMLLQSRYGVKGKHLTLLLTVHWQDIYSPELQQIEEEFVRICGHKSSLMNVEQFSQLMIQLGFIPDLCQQCFKCVTTL